jgi:hypothetical protein
LFKLQKKGKMCMVELNFSWALRKKKVSWVSKLASYLGIVSWNIYIYSEWLFVTHCFFFFFFFLFSFLFTRFWQYQCWPQDLTLLKMWLNFNVMGAKCV